VKRNRDVRRLLRWYPPSWRARYEEEYVAFLEDRLDDAPFTWRFRSSVAFAGVRERCYQSGAVGTRSTTATQRRTGSLIVLVAWSVVTIGGAALAKTAEQFPSALAARSRVVAEFAYNATAVAGIAGTLLVVAGALIATPGFVRFVRAQRWVEVRRVFWTSIVATTTLVVVTLGLTLWAHRLTSAQRNGTDGLYSGMFLVFVFVVVVSIALWARTCVAIASRIDFTPRELRWESGVAFGVSLTSIVVISSTSVWWIQMGLRAPWFLEGTSRGIVASLTSAQLLAIMIPMLLGTLLALWGASRVALTYRSRADEAR
jgi:hypothetical protein